jgi:predicted RNA binding protein YcfA (HicA-like mRNA interferase family)
MGSGRVRRDRCVKKRDLERHLNAHGCALARQAANHEVWQNMTTGQRTTVPPTKRSSRRPHAAYAASSAYRRRPALADRLRWPAERDSRGDWLCSVATLWQRPDRAICPMRPIYGRYGRSGRGRTYLHFSHGVEGLVSLTARGGSSPLKRMQKRW